MFSDTFRCSTAKSPKIQPPEIPYFIPTVARSGMIIPDEPTGLTLGVSLGRIIGKRGNLAYKNVEQVRRKFRMPSNAKVALIGTSPDHKLENLWKIRETHCILERIAGMGFDWVTSLTFSVWAKEFPRAHQLTNQWRNFQTYDMFTSLGVPCIPFLFPVEDSDFKSTAKWLADRPEIKTVAVYARYYHQKDNFPIFLDFMERLKLLTNRRMSFLVCGIGKGENIAYLKSKFDARFENSLVFEKSIHGEICDETLEYSQSILSRDELFSINMKKNLEFCMPQVPRPIIYMPDVNLLEPTVNKDNTAGLA